MRRLYPALLGLLACATASGQDMDDVLGGFEDLPSIELADDTPEARDETSPWNFDAALALSSSWNLVDHDSSSGTDYDGLSRLRLRGDLGLEYRFSEHWRARLSGNAAHDAAYAINDADYSPEVLDEYENDAQLQLAHVQGRLASAWDMKLGRQVAAWGFADTLRVLDVLNPLDNREPGLADIEDLRLGVAMLRLDHFRGPWQFSGFAIPEQRFSRNPPFGSDFYSLTDENGDAVRIREEQPEDFDSLNAGLSAVGRFSGWDLSLNAARTWLDQPYLDGTAFDSSDPDASSEDFFAAAVLRHSRVNQFGFGSQATVGGWLFKQEASLTTDVLLTVTREVEGGAPVVGGLPIVGGLDPTAQSGFVPDRLSRHRLYQGLLGLEYYGLADTTFALELAHRQIGGFHPGLARSGYVQRRAETALRITRDLLRTKLRITALAVRFDRDGDFSGASGGALYRLNADYALRDTWQLTGGALLYSRGRQQPFGIIGDNDRLYLELRWTPL